MASVFLDFTPPDRPGFIKLFIYEAPSEETAPGAVIETVTAIGEYPDYITRYSTDDATGVSKWFSIQWEDDKGVKTDVSAPVQGNTQTLVGQIVARTLLRDPTLNELVVTQAAEFVIETYFGGTDPYEVDSAQTYRTLEGLTLLTMARSLLALISSGASSESYTAGLVSQKKGTGANNFDLIKYLLGESAKLLGQSTGFVMVLEDIDPTGMGTVSSISYDQTRLALTVNFE